MTSTPPPMRMSSQNLLCEAPGVGAVYSERWSRPDGSTVTRSVVRRADAAAVLPVDLPAGEFLLVRQPREATGGFTLEVVAGKVDDGETPQQAAARELAEETGFHARSLEALGGGFYPSPGWTDERIYLYLADDLEPDTDGHQPDSDEQIEIVRFPLTDMIDVAMRDVEDAKTRIALLLAARKLGT